MFSNFSNAAALAGTDNYEIHYSQEALEKLFNVVTAKKLVEFKLFGMLETVVPLTFVNFMKVGSFQEMLQTHP